MAGPPSAAAIQYANHHFGGLHPPLPPAGPSPHPTTAIGPILPPIPLQMPPSINLNNSHITPAAMAAAHAHPPLPPHLHPHHHPPLPIPPPTISGQHHHLMVNNKRAAGPSPASGPTNTIENNIGISGPVDCWSTAVTGHWQSERFVPIPLLSHSY